jgi:hypothetical protein
MHYLRGKADWMLRSLPCAPAPSMRERLRALPYFVNNLAPGIRANWIAVSRRATVMQCTKDDLPRLRPADEVAASAMRTGVVAVVLNSESVLLGAIEAHAKAACAIDAVNPAPQTIRPDMTHRLAGELLQKHPYLLVTTSFGKYLGRYEPPSSEPATAG